MPTLELGERCARGGRLSGPRAKARRRGPARARAARRGEPWPASPSKAPRCSWTPVYEPAGGRLLNRAQQGGAWLLAVAERLRGRDVAVERPAQDGVRHRSGGIHEALTPHLNRRCDRDRRGSHVLASGRQLRRSDRARLPLAVGEHPLLLRPEGVRADTRHQALADVRSHPRRLRDAAAASLPRRRLARLRARRANETDALLRRQPRLRDPPRLHDPRLRQELDTRPVHLHLPRHRRHCRNQGAHGVFISRQAYRTW